MPKKAVAVPIVEDVPSGVKKPLASKDLKAASYRVTRVTSGGDISHRIDGQPSLFIPGVKDPAEMDPHVPAYMNDADRELYPDGIRWSAVLDTSIVKSLLDTYQKDFSVEPVE